MTKTLPIFFISEWISFGLIETTAILRCCAIFNAVVQTATSSSFDGKVEVSIRERREKQTSPVEQQRKSNPRTYRARRSNVEDCLSPREQRARQRAGKLPITMQRGAT
jgi:hypothetical protein